MLWLRTYADARADIKREIVAQFLKEASVDPKAEKLPRTSLDEAAEHRANLMLDEFTKLAIRNSFWGNVWQSFLGSFAFAAFIGGIYIVIIGSQIGFRELADRILHAQVTQPDQKPSGKQ